MSEAAQPCGASDPAESPGREPVVPPEARQEIEAVLSAFRQGVDKVQQQAQGWLDPLVRDRDRLRDDLADQRESQQRSWVELLLDVRDALARGAAAAALGDRQYSPQEISAMILRALKDRADDGPVLELVRRARALLPEIPSQDRDELTGLINQIDEALQSGQPDRAGDTARELEEILFYLEEAR